MEMVSYIWKISRRKPLCLSSAIFMSETQACPLGLSHKCSTWLIGKTCVIFIGFIYLDFSLALNFFQSGSYWMSVWLPHSSSEKISSNLNSSYFSGFAYYLIKLCHICYKFWWHFIDRDQFSRPSLKFPRSWKPEAVLNLEFTMVLFISLNGTN